MNNTDVPIWEKYTLSIEEASRYFRIGEKKCVGLPRKIWTLAGLSSMEIVFR